MSIGSLDLEWSQQGTAYSPRSRADKIKLLPGGVYQFIPTLGGWFLDRTHDEFEFPFKVYDASKENIDRIVTYWKTNGGNLGVLMNGLRGAGKTMTAQLLANQLIKTMNLPVLVVKEPIPLQSVFDTVKQDLMVIFDEFEKTHPKEEQQKLLSTIDGMSRSTFGRLCVFTTNNPNIDENFKDRPSRIRYSFEYQRVADEIIEGLINDSLPKDLQHLRDEIFDFLHSRQICTIDIVKAVIAEVKTFRESPLQFEGILNVSKGEPPAFTVAIVDPATNAVRDTLCYYFRAEHGQGPLLSGNKRAVKDFVDSDRPLTVCYRTNDGTFMLNLLEKCEEENLWLANVAVPIDKTPWCKFTSAGLQDHHYTLWVDNRPKDWKPFPAYEAVKTVEEELNKLQDRYEECAAMGTVYGTGEKAIFKISIVPNRTTPVRNYSPNGNLSTD